MPDIFDISTTQASADLLPDSERTAENKAFLKSLLSGLASMWEYFLSYKRGADIQAGSAAWTAGTYSQYETAYYLPTGQVFECTVSSTTTEPTTSTDWRKVLDCFIGVDESQNFGVSHIGLTYALNRRFGGTFVADPSVSSSDIYLENVIEGDAMFQVGYDDADCSAIYADTCTEQLTYEDTNILGYTFIIWVPASITALLGATFADAAKVVRRFADQYITAGVNYFVEEY